MNHKHLLVHVEWEDSNSQDAWQNLDDIGDSPTTCFSVGWLVHRNGERIRVASTIGDNDEACLIMTIPLSCVKQITELNIESI